VSRFISGKIVEEGSATVPLSILSGIINNSDSERIKIETDGHNLIVSTDNYTAKIQGVAPDEFPIIPKINNLDYYIEISSDILKNALAKVIICAQVSNVRPEISGILFDFQLTVLKLTATDSFRLAEKSIFNNQFKTNFIRGFKVIVPIKTVQEIMRIFPDHQTLYLHVDPNQISVKSEDIELISRLIDGDYPDYQSIIPKEIETEIIINKNHFINGLRLISNFSGRINESILRLKDSKKILEVYSASQYLGENNYLIPVKVKGKDFGEIKFNWRYLLDGVKIIDGDNIIFGINGEVKPAIIKSPEDVSYFYILMPIKIG